MAGRSMFSVVVLAVAAVVVLAGHPVVSAQAPKLPIVFTAFATNLGSGPNAGTVDIAIERLSTDEERAGLIAAFMKGGQDALLNALQKIRPRVGYIKLPTRLGYDLQYAYRFPNPDGTVKVVIATDRKIGFGEAATSARTMDYPFTLIEMHLNKEGKGEGRLALGVQITRSRDGKTIELENYGISPVALNNISVLK